MEEDREQPIIMPATALNGADEDCAVSEVGSQQNDNLGKFKSVEALLSAYNNLEAEFTKKCQQLSQLKQDKENEQKVDEKPDEEQSEKLFRSFLDENGEAEKYADEIKEKVGTTSQNQNPYEAAWANVLLKHLKSEDKLSDPILSQYILNDENVRNKILEEYIKNLNDSKPPIIFSSQSGERLSGYAPDSPKTLDEAKKIVNKMFS